MLLYPSAKFGDRCKDMVICLENALSLHILNTHRWNRQSYLILVALERYVHSSCFLFHPTVQTGLGVDAKISPGAGPRDPDVKGSEVLKADKGAVLLEYAVERRPWE
jgi:hypothetical protein